MSRRKLVSKRVVLPDPKFNSALVTKFVNMLMYDGKKSIAEQIFYGALDQIRDRTGNRDVLAVFNKAVSNTKPILEIRSRPLVCQSCDIIRQLLLFLVYPGWNQAC